MLLQVIIHTIDSCLKGKTTNNKKKTWRELKGFQVTFIEHVKIFTPTLLCTKEKMLLYIIFS